MEQVVPDVEWWDQFYLKTGQYEDALEFFDTKSGEDPIRRELITHYGLFRKKKIEKKKRKERKRKKERKKERERETGEKKRKKEKLIGK